MMKNNKKIVAIVMASGLSKRMGTDKLLLPFRKKLLFQHILDTLGTLPFEEILIVTTKDKIAEYAEKKDMKVLFNENAHKGQSASIIIGLENAQKADGYMFFVADQPFLKRETIQNLMNVFVENCEKIVLPFFRGIKGNPVIFPHRVKKDLMNITGDQGGSVVIKKEWENAVKIDFDNELEGLDIDTMENYNKYKEN